MTPPERAFDSERMFEWMDMLERKEALAAKWRMRETRVEVIDLDEEDVEESSSDPRWLRYVPLLFLNLSYAA